MKEKPKHIQLLEFLEKYGSGKLVDISSFMIGNFTKPETIDIDEYSTRVREPILFLMDLNTRQLIKADDWDDGDKHSSFIAQPSHRPHYEKPLWYSDFETNVYITSAGLDYLENYRSNFINTELNKSYQNVNQASIKNYRTQRNLSLLTAALALGSVLISFLTYHKSDLTAVSVDSLRSEIRTWRIEQKNKSTQTSSGMEFPHKPQPSVLNN